MMRRATIAAVLSVGSLLYLAPARAQDDRNAEIPEHFVPDEQCMSRPCTCQDAPIIQQFILNQRAGYDAFELVFDALPTSAGARTGKQAIEQAGRFLGDGNPHVNAQFMSCAGFDASKNSLKKIAGISLADGPMLDPCFCDAFCQDIIDATVAHERTHWPTLLLNFHARISASTGCKLGLLPERVCQVIEPANLVESEMTSYGIGIRLLESSLADIKQSDPAMPEMMCTWMPLASAGRVQPASRVPAPPSFFARVVLLFERMLWGEAEQSVELAALDAAR